MSWLAAPLNHLQRLVASSEKFREVTEKADLEAAKAKVLRWSASDKLEAEQIPRAIIGTSGNRMIKKKSTTHWDVSGQLAIMLEFESPPEYQTSRDAAFDWFYSTVDTILDQLIDQSGKDGHLIVKDFMELEPPDFMDTDDENGKWILTTIWLVAT